MRPIISLVLVVLGGAVLLGFLANSRLEAQDRIRELEQQVQQMKNAWQSASAARDAALQRTDELQYQLTAVRAELANTMRERDSWKMQFVEAIETVRRLQAEQQELVKRMYFLQRSLNSSNGLASALFGQPVSLADSSVGFLVAVGLAGIALGISRFGHRWHTLGQSSVVMVALPRPLTKAYARWLRGQQAGEPWWANGIRKTSTRADGPVDDNLTVTVPISDAVAGDIER